MTNYYIAEKINSSYKKREPEICGNIQNFSRYINLFKYRQSQTLLIVLSNGKRLQENKISANFKLLSIIEVE